MAQTIDFSNSQDYLLPTNSEGENVVSKDNALAGWVDDRNCWLGSNNLSSLVRFSQYVSGVYGATVQLLP